MMDESRLEQWKSELDCMPLLMFDDSLDQALASRFEYTPEMMKKVVRLDQALRLEYQFIRAPYENYRSLIFGLYHNLSRPEINKIILDVNVVAESNKVSKLDTLGCLSSAVEKLKLLKEQVEKVTVAEERQVSNIWDRFNHLEEAHSENLPEWHKVRVYRVIMDYLLHTHCYDTAEKLAERLGLQVFLDIEVFKIVEQMWSEFGNKKIASAIAWCADHESKERAFKKFMRALIERAASYDKVGATDEARGFSDPGFSDREIRNHGNISRSEYFKRYSEPKIWDWLQEAFWYEYFSSKGLLTQPLLQIYLEAGLSALKTVACNHKDCPVEDPLSQEDFRKLALKLPERKLQHSEIYCRIKKESMHADNKLVALPNGYAYSWEALSELARSNNGWIACPRTGFVCHSSELKVLNIVNMCY